MREPWLDTCSRCGDDVHWLSNEPPIGAWKDPKVCAACRLDDAIAEGRQSARMRDRSRMF